MRPEFHLSLKSTVTLIDDGDDLLVADNDGRAVRIQEAGPDVREMLDNLASGGRTAESLCRGGSSDDGDGDRKSVV